MKILVTGAAGFIGSKLMFELAKRGDDVTGLDSINDYYDTRLKYGRLKACGFDPESVKEDGKMVRNNMYDNCKFIRLSLSDKQALDQLFEAERFEKVMNLAAQAGVRYSITNPYAYLESNLVGFLNVLEACRNYGVKHLVYASSSSVYGLNDEVPYKETANVDSPVSLYAATKKSNELMAHAYSKLYGLATSGLRYFTVYGPWGRPDMSPTLFASAISEGRAINVFNNGDMIRDFTFIDDIVEGTMRVIDHTPDATKCDHSVPYRVYNIGCSQPVKLIDFISEIESALGKEAKKVFLPMQQGDVYQTNADTTRLETELGYHPQTSLHDGIRQFIDWYVSDDNPLR